MSMTITIRKRISMVSALKPASSRSSMDRAQLQWERDCWFKPLSTLIIFCHQWPHVNGNVNVNINSHSHSQRSCHGQCFCLSIVMSKLILSFLSINSLVDVNVNVNCISRLNVYSISSVNDKVNVNVNVNGKDRLFCQCQCLYQFQGTIDFLKLAAVAEWIK